MHIDEILDEMDKDIPLGSANLDYELSKSHDLFLKYKRLLLAEERELRVVAAQQTKIIKNLYDYYSGNAKPEVYKQKPFSKKLTTNSMIEKYVYADKNYIGIHEKIQDQDEKIKLLQSALENIKSRNYSIKSMIDYQRFTNGL
jgi:hypothetical protein